MMLNAGELSWKLQERREDLVYHLFPDARWVGHELRWHGSDGCAWSMAMRGGKAGRWASWGDPKHVAGDALDLVHHAMFPYEQGRRQSCQWAARWLGVDEEPYLSPAEALARRREAIERQQLRKEAEKEAKEKALRRALARYLSGTKPMPNCPEIDDYLLSRGIAVEDLSSYPESLRFVASTGYDYELQMPGMLAPVVHAVSRTMIGCHVTYLHCGPNGWRKASVDPPKKVHGGFKGGLIPLLRGASGKPFSSAPYGDTILIAEGIENALAASLSWRVESARRKVPVEGNPRVVACVNAGNLPEIVLPEAFRTVILVYDRDGENDGVFRSRDRAVAQFLAQKRLVFTTIPDEGTKDFSDLLVVER